MPRRLLHTVINVLMNREFLTGSRGKGRRVSGRHTLDPGLWLSWWGGGGCMNNWWVSGKKARDGCRTSRPEECRQWGDGNRFTWCLPGFTGVSQSNNIHFITSSCHFIRRCFVFAQECAQRRSIYLLRRHLHRHIGKLRTMLRLKKHSKTFLPTSFCELIDKRCLNQRIFCFSQPIGMFEFLIIHLF